MHFTKSAKKGSAIAALSIISVQKNHIALAAVVVVVAVVVVAVVMRPWATVMIRAIIA
jgi:hypothetical protein